MTLQLTNLVAGHGRLVAARVPELTVGRGEVLALLGPNGAGKTTLLKTIAGLLPRLGGEVVVDRTSLSSGDPLAANRSGLVLVPDNRALFGSLTTAENLAIAGRRSRAAVDDVLDLFPALRPRLSVPAGSLSGGEQQMLAVARALVQNPTVLLIDEMSMGLAPVIVEQLLPVLRRVADATDAAVVLVEQHVDIALGVADSAAILVHGEIVLSAPAAEIRADRARLTHAYFGEPAATGPAQT